MANPSGWIVALAETFEERSGELIYLLNLKYNINNGGIGSGI
jgi:hypothetical protein